MKVPTRAWMVGFGLAGVIAIVARDMLTASIGLPEQTGPYILTFAGVALIAQETGPSRALVARLVIGQPARIDRYVGSTLVTLCSGATVTADYFTALHYVVTSDSITASSGMVALVSCDFSRDPIAPDAGSWGIAAIANGSLDVVTVAVSR